MDGSKRNGGSVTPPSSHAALVSDETVDDHGHRRFARATDRGAGAAAAQPPPTDASLHDRVLGDFVLGAVLGRGGGGTVYRAEQRGLDRPAVVKVVHRSV